LSGGKVLTDLTEIALYCQLQGPHHWTDMARCDANECPKRNICGEYKKFDKMFESIDPTVRRIKHYKVGDDNQITKVSDRVVISLRERRKEMKRKKKARAKNKRKNRFPTVENTCRPITSGATHSSIPPRNGGIAKEERPFHPPMPRGKKNIGRG